MKFEIMENKDKHLLIMVMAILFFSNTAIAQLKSDIYKGLEFEMPKITEVEFP